MGRVTDRAVVEAAVSSNLSVAMLYVDITSAFASTLRQPALPSLRDVDHWRPFVVVLGFGDAEIEDWISEAKRVVKWGPIIHTYAARRFTFHEVQLGRRGLCSGSLPNVRRSHRRSSSRGSHMRALGRAHDTPHSARSSRS